MINALRMENDTTAAIVSKAYFKLLPVQILGIIVNALNGFIDSFITSRFLGTQALAAIGYFGPVSTIIGITWVVTTGIQIMCSQYIGGGDKNKVNSLFSTGIVFLSGFALLVTTLCMIFHTPLAVVLGGRGETAGMLSDYILGYAPGIIGQVLSGVLMVFLPFNSDTKRSYYAITIMIASNVIMDILNVTVLEWGCFGMGLATTISFLLSTAVMLGSFLDKERTINLRFTNLCFNLLPHAARLGLPSLMFTLGCTAKGYIINLAMMQNVGDAAVAVINIQNNIIAILGAVPQGCANALLTLASLYYGDEDRKSFLSITRLSLRVGIILSLIMTLILMAGSSVIPGIFFAPSDEAFGIARMMLLLFPNWLVLNLLFNVFTKIYQCQNKMALTNALSFAENVLIAAIGALLAASIGANGVWISFTIAESLCLLVIMISVFLNARKITFSLEDWTKLSPEFGADPDNCLEFSLHSMDEVINISERVIDFCNARSHDKRRSQFTGLAIEEMAGNVVEHGFKPGEKNSIDVRVVSGDEFIIRIRDDCRSFDPHKYLSQFTQEDPAKNIGLRIITKTAREIIYQNNAGINTLIVKE